MGRSQDDLATLCAIGVLAAIAAALAHEAVGHGGTCLVSKGDITLLSVIWFRCSTPGVTIDLAGPLGGLIGGFCGLTLAAIALSVRMRMFGLMLGSFALFWFSAQMVSQTISASDDWQVAAVWPWAVRIAVSMFGVVFYGTLIRLVWSLAARIGRGPLGWRRFLVPYASGALALVACASLRPSDGSALETFRAVGVAPLGYLWAVTRTSVGNDVGIEVAHSWRWILSGLIGLVLYGATFGVGLGPLA